MSQIDTFDVLAHHLGRACGCTPHQVGEELCRQATCYYPLVVFPVRGPCKTKLPSAGLNSQHRRAHDRTCVPDIIGIKIGAVVEGIGVEVAPHKLLFPFPPKDLEAAIKAIEHEADFYWRRDNSRWFCLRSPHKKDYWFHHGPHGGKAVWDGKKPRSKKIRELVDKFCEEHYPGIFRESLGAYERCNELDVFVVFMGTNWIVKEWKNTSSYEGRCDDR